MSAQDKRFIRIEDPKVRHRRSQSPPRLRTTFVEESKETVVRVAKASTPESVKKLGRAMVPYVQKGLKGVEQGFVYMGDHVPGARVVGHVVKEITVGGLEVIDRTLEVMPTAMRRTARTLGLPQNWAQNIGDATHLLQEIGLIVMPAVKAIRMERATASVARNVRTQQITGFSNIESQVINEARSILKSTEIEQIRIAYKNGKTATINISGRLIQYEPQLPASGMTLFGENGFLIGREAFTSTQEFQQTILHELYRLYNSASISGISGSLAAHETKAAADFAAKAIKVLE